MGTFNETLVSTVSVGDCEKRITQVQLPSLYTVSLTKNKGFHCTTVRLRFAATRRCGRQEE